MLSAVIAANDSDRALVPTLACLVSGATAGILRDVIVADAGSSNETAEIADIAGCRLIVSPGPLGARLKGAAHAARGPWLLFLPAGVVLEPSWIAEAVRFIGDAEASPEARAAIFRPAAIGGMRPTLAEALALLRFAFTRRCGPEQGLLIAKSFYRQLGGHQRCRGSGGRVAGSAGLSTDVRAALPSPVGAARNCLTPSSDSLTISAI
jgi:hypothetical protein